MEQQMANNLVSASTSQVDAADAAKDIEQPASAHVRSARQDRATQTAISWMPDLSDAADRPYAAHAEFVRFRLEEMTGHRRVNSKWRCCGLVSLSLLFSAVVIVILLFICFAHKGVLSPDKSSSTLHRRNYWDDIPVRFSCGTNWHGVGPCNVQVSDESPITQENLPDWMLNNCQWRKGKHRIPADAKVKRGKKGKKVKNPEEMTTEEVEKEAKKVEDRKKKLDKLKGYWQCRSKASDGIVKMAEDPIKWSPDGANGTVYIVPSIPLRNWPG